MEDPGGCGMGPQSLYQVFRIRIHSLNPDPAKNLYQDPDPEDPRIPVRIQVLIQVIS